MTIVIALIIAVVFQFIAASLAISLIRYTKYNFSWVLISVSFLLMAVRRLIELMHVLRSDQLVIESAVNSWMAVAISIFILAGLIFIKRIFNLQKKIDDLQKENEVKVLSAILKTEEDERLKFAKELHDGLGPLLSSIKMAVSSLSPGRIEPGSRKILDNTNKLIDESVSVIKEISNKLSPHVLNHFGLLKAIDSFIERLEFPDTLSINVNSNLKDIRFDNNIEVVLYLIVCELINNTINHACAIKVNIYLYYDKTMLTLDYYDNWKCFYS